MLKTPLLFIVKPTPHKVQAVALSFWLSVCLFVCRMKRVCKMHFFKTKQLLRVVVSIDDQWEVLHGLVQRTHSCTPSMILSDSKPPRVPQQTPVKNFPPPPPPREIYANGGR